MPTDDINAVALNSGIKSTFSPLTYNKLMSLTTVKKVFNSEVFNTFPSKPINIWHFLSSTSQDNKIIHKTQMPSEDLF